MPGRHQNAAGGRGSGRRRAAAWVAVLAAAGLGAVVTATWLVSAHSHAPAHAAAPVSWPGPDSITAAVSRPAASLLPAGREAAPGDGPPVLGPRARRSCPRSAEACADLRDHLTWLQSRGQITYGPVRMEPGSRRDPTPRGIFHVSWKAGPHYISTSFGIPIPWAVFFAPGGIAFHAGPLNSSSHGCVHLSLRDAHYFHSHLAEGAEVAVF
jgi:hypothetical protein